MIRFLTSSFFAHDGGLANGTILPRNVVMQHNFLSSNFEVIVNLQPDSLIAKQLD
ncbi:3486_t:CDS:2 [Entrophospora sp. SA101]|nr:3486_t:CDS:2 [Entrophospora sp. SA101]